MCVVFDDIRFDRTEADRMEREIVGLSDGAWSGGLRGCREHRSGRLSGVGGFGWGLVLACHGSGDRADGLRWIAGGARAARTFEV